MLENVITFIIWYLFLLLMGLIALPITQRLFRWLPDQGYALARPLGLLLTSYGLWVLVSAGFLRNTRSAILFVMLLIGIGSALLARRHHIHLSAFYRRNKPIILVTELLFLIGFAGWTVYRAYNPELDHTEKPMELAFLNAILRSETFPPHDPWLAGYTISYYYFGYLIAAVLTRLTDTPSSVAFNLMIALLFALTLTGAYSLAYNLIAGLRNGARSLFAAVAALLGPLFVAIVGNLEGLLDVLHTRGLGSPAFWEWLDIQNINTPPTPDGWIPDRVWWWWRASRVITQRDPVSGNPVEIIDEFPFFSFLLGDMHPHVLALPFVFLALALALNILLGTRREEDWLPIPQLSPMALLLPLIVGTFGFLHSWDFPTYFLVITAAYALRRYIELGRLTPDWLRDVSYFGLWLLALSIILFVFFHIGPRPFTGGIGLVGSVKTKFRQFFVMFGLYLFIIISFLIPQVRDWWQRARQTGITPTAWLILGTAAVIAGFCLFLGWWTAAILALLMALTGIILLEKLDLARSPAPSATETEPESTLAIQFGNPVSASLIFALFLIAVGLAVPFATEFVFVRDRFGTRMNTIFKLYYQAWTMLATAAAFCVYYLLRRWSTVWRLGWSLGLTALVLTALVYPALASYTRASRFDRPATLDGIAYIQTYQPAEYAAIRWFQENVKGAPTILEAPGDSYRADTNRISTTTGLPTLLGWGGHETQWRDPVPELAQRDADIATIYRSLDLNTVGRLLDHYQIQYVYVGPIEITKYQLTPAQIDKFDALMERVFEQDNVRIYKR